MQSNAVGALFATVGLVVAAAAQAGRPDFSGTWKMDPEQSESIVNSFEPTPVTIVARQTDTDLVVETSRSGETETLVYKLDGSRTFLPGDVVTSSRWNGGSFVMNTARKVSGWTVTLDETWTLDASGPLLRSEKTLNVQHGYERGAGPTYTVVKDVYVRSEKR